MFQSFLRHGNELRLVVGGAARLGVPFHPSWPQHVFLAVAHAVDVTFERLIVVQRHTAHKVVVCVHVAKAVVSAVLRITGAAHQPAQHLPLQCLGLVVVAFQLPPAGGEELSCYACQTHFLCFIFCIAFCLPRAYGILYNSVLLSSTFTFVVSKSWLQRYTKSL